MEEIELGELLIEDDIDDDYIEDDDIIRQLRMSTITYTFRQTYTYNLAKKNIKINERKTKSMISYFRKERKKHKMYLDNEKMTSNKNFKFKKKNISCKNEGTKKFKR